MFGGMEEDFEIWWALKSKDQLGRGRLDPVNNQEKEKRWSGMLNWAGEFRQLDQSIIPRRQVECMVETRQHYGEFTMNEINHTLRQLGRVANFFYGPRVWDVFEVDHVLYPERYNPMAKYYYLALERTMWRVATIEQKDKIPKRFCDLATRIKRLFNKKKKKNYD